MNLALFDFDGTITRKDSFLGFLKHSFPPSAIWRGIIALSPWLAGYKLGFVSPGSLKEKVMTRFFRGSPVAELERMGEKYAAEALPHNIRNSAIEKINEHITTGDRVVIVSASVEHYIEPFASGLGVDLIATGLELRDGLLTGKLSGPNCRGPEKVRRIKEAYDLEEFSSIYAYGDSAGDREMLALADYRFYKHF